MYAVIVVFALLVLAGFYFIFDKMSSLQATVNSFERQAAAEALVPTPAQPQIPTPTPPPATSTPTTTTPQDSSLTIPTAIIFSASSSPALQPQGRLTVQVEKAVKSSDGTITLSIKVFTGEVTSYTSFDPKDVLQILNLEGDNTTSSLVTGSFSSMPPKGAVTGSVLFKTDPARGTFILQVGPVETAKFYEFDWSRKTYTETVVG
jgi:hypothetical protein